ncbi:MAG: helix-turn-helix domain-containing protein [Propionibacteriaceae bacterium]|nr:helix-turn-helix domain-containing protein [Propionibacteriaceae bacterium]
MDALAEKCQQRRTDLRLTQTEAAELAGVSERFVRLVESGKLSVRLDKLTALLTVLGLELRLDLRGQ